MHGLMEIAAAAFGFFHKNAKKKVDCKSETRMGVVAFGCEERPQGWTLCCEEHVHGSVKMAMFCLNREQHVQRRRYCGRPGLPSAAKKIAEKKG